MEDTPDELPKPPRRTAARPFVSPRPEGVTGPLDLSRRRAAQLFTPPGSSPGAPSTPAAPPPASRERIDDSVATPHSADAADAESPRIKSYDAPALGGDDAWQPAAKRETEETLDAESLLAHRNTTDDGHDLFVEQFEPEEIELTSSSATTIPDEHSIEVIAYDDANSLLRAAADEGEGPQVDGLRLETTEFSFHGGTREAPLDVESFWATQPFEGASAASATPSADAESREERDVERAEMKLDEAESVDEHEAHPLEWGTVDTVRDDFAPGLADNRPPWARIPTPVSTEALEELKESEPWAATPAAAEPAAIEEHVVPEVAHQAPVQEPAIEARAPHPVAELLDRIAARVRDGEIDVPAGAAANEAAALAAVLTALLRQAR